METQVLTPQKIFTHPQRLVVPLFQRPYVWNEVEQWEPLWNDIVRISDRIMRQPNEKHFPHFLGAVVLQQVQNTVATMQERTIIDGQQRLTTLQLFFDALHAELMTAKATAPAKRIEPLIVNAVDFCQQPEDRFKVWPTNRDRPAFNAVMAAEPPVDYGAVGHANERMVQAHRYFGEQARKWLSSEGPDHIASRASAIETVVRDHLQMVVIDLGAEENAQEIFETLNARGAQLTAADLIKNFVFQRLLEAGADVEKTYEQYWKGFESAFWETEISVGRVRSRRSSIFLYHWLVARTGEDLVASEVFTRFKRYANEIKQPMQSILAQVDRGAEFYRFFVQGGDQKSSSIDRLGLFAYRTSVLESEVIKPLVLFLRDSELPQIPADQFTKALNVVESWMVRRMLVRATTKGYNKIVADLIRSLKKVDRSIVGDAIEKYLVEQTSGSSYWPDDIEIRDELRVLPAYRRLSRGRLRMVLEAIEDHMRGWRGSQSGLGGERIARGKYAIEHVMPRKWNAHWPHPDGARGEVERDSQIHTLGNLTLLTSRLNSKVSNGPWLGDSGKRKGLETHDVLLLNRELLKTTGDTWTDTGIRLRSDVLSQYIIEIWPAPEGHRSGFGTEKVGPRHRLDLLDLISAGCLQPGMPLIPRRKKFADTVAILLLDGRIDVGGKIYSTPSEAAKAINGGPANGWWFFLVDAHARRSLRDARIEYLESIAADPEEDDSDDDAEDED
ncbi:MAG: DUF262 domain-containing protein [Pirellulaceae bacterium]|nr:DUF262 domain-containing protein [Pirellulaceae bacterium]